MLTTFIIAVAMVAAFFGGRYSIILQDSGHIKKMVTLYLQKTLPNEITFNINTSEISFNKPYPGELTVKFEGEDEAIDALLADKTLSDSMRKKVEEIRDKLDSE